MHPDRQITRSPTLITFLIYKRPSSRLFPLTKSHGNHDGNIAKSTTRLQCCPITSPSSCSHSQNLYHHPSLFAQSVMAPRPDRHLAPLIHHSRCQNDGASRLRWIQRRRK
jgi:hypothetical protein